MEGVVVRRPKPPRALPPQDLGQLTEDGVDPSNRRPSEPKEGRETFRRFSIGMDYCRRMDVGCLVPICLERDSIKVGWNNGTGMRVEGLLDPPCADG